MVDVKRELVLLLASDEMSDAEFRAATAWLVNGGLDECVRGAERVRAVFGSGPDVPMPVPQPPPRAKAKDASGGTTRSSMGRDAEKTTSDGESAVFDQVRELLLKDAKLGAAEAATALAARVGYTAPLPQKKSLAEAISRLVAAVGSSEVLWAATQIREERGNSDSVDAWRLRGSRD